MKNFKQFLNEVAIAKLLKRKSLRLNEMIALTPRELLKPNSATGESRLDILKREIENNKPLELASGGFFIVTDIRGAIESIEKFKKDNSVFTLNGANGSIKSSDLGKSKLFGGGGGGAGGGVKMTAMVESAQCAWIQAMLDNGIKSLDFFTDDVLKKAYSKVKVDTKLDEILSLDDSWILSSYNVAKHVIENGYAYNGLVCHRGTKQMKAIYDAKNTALKNQGSPKISDDKWNPADIWLIDKSFNVNSLPTDSIESLNAEIAKQFEARKLIGISLKKVINNPRHAVLNLGKTAVNIHKLKNYSLSAQSRGTIWSSKNAYIYYDDGYMELRTNAAFATHKAEIKGKTARGGGIGWGIIQNYAKATLGVTLPSTKDMIKTAKSIVEGDKKEIELFWKMLSKIEPSVQRSEFDNEMLSKDAIWVHAKLGSMLILYAMSNNKHLINKFITQLINYAGSQIEESSTYLKVYE